METLTDGWLADWLAGWMDGWLELVNAILFVCLFVCFGCQCNAMQCCCKLASCL